jgi:mRNA interferase MazF
MVTERFSMFLVRLDPATGAETAKTRPCVVVSPDELNQVPCPRISKTQLARH